MEQLFHEYGLYPIHATGAGGSNQERRMRKEMTICTLEGKSLRTMKYILSKLAEGEPIPISWVDFKIIAMVSFDWYILQIDNFVLYAYTMVSFII